MQRRIWALLAGLTLIGALASPVAALAPEAPTGVSASVSGTSVTVVWTPAAAGDPATEYSVDIGGGVAPQTVTASPATFTSLAPGSYTPTVTAINLDGVGGSASGAAVVVEAPATVPDVPTVSASAVGDTQIDVSWSTPADGGSPLTGYTVTLSNGASQPVGVGVNSTSFTGLGPGTYTASVVASNGVGDSGAGTSGSVTLNVPATVPDVPTVSASAVGDTQIDVSWSTPADGGSPLTGYTVTLSNGASQPVGVGVNSTSFTGLGPGTYTASVVASNGVGDSGAGTSGSVTLNVPATVPDVPTVSASAVGDTQIDVSWSTPADGGSPLTGYTVTLSNGASQPVGVGVNSTSFTGLGPGTYTASVVASNGVGDSGAGTSGSVTLNVPATVPDVPTVSASAVGDTQIDVSWSTPADGGSPLTGYTVTLNGGSPQSIAAGVNSTSFTGLAPGSYTVEVVAANAIGTSGAGSASVTLVAAATPPGTPTGVSATANGDTQIDVSWLAPDDGGSPLTGYTISLSPGGASQPVGPGVTFVSFLGLGPGTYTASVVATNAVGSSAPGNSGPVTLNEPVGVPDAPTGVGAGLVGTTSLGVSWTAPANNGGAPISGYTVTLSPGGFSQTVTSTSTQFDGLTQGVTYTASVVANNAAGSSSAATSNSVLIPAPSAPNTPTGLSLTALGGGQLLANWSAPADNGSPITNYLVQLSDGRQFNTGTNTSITIDASPGSYSFTVLATNAQGSSPASASSNTVTLASLPDAPTGVTASVNGSSVTINWTAPNNNGSPIEFYTITLSNGQVGYAGATTITFDSLPPGTYTAVVAATNGIGIGPTSSSSNGVEVLTSPSAPTSVDATASGANVTVVWSAPLSNGGLTITQYVVTLSGPTPTSPVTVDGNTFSAQFLNLGPGSYTATVIAVNAIGQSPQASVNVSVGALTPSAPRDVQAVSRGQEVTVSWLAPSDGGNTPITGYEVTIGLLVTTVNDASATSVVFSDVPEGGPYVASVRAINAAGAGDAGVSNEFASTRPFAPFFSSDAFVAQQYEDFLGRTPDAAGLAFWKGVVADDPANAALVIQSFMESPEFAPRRQIARLYLAYFDRPPDRDGFDFWSELFISGQADLGVISAAFAESNEFQNKYGSLSDIEFVALVYNNVLLRAPDGPGITYWTNLLSQGLNRGEMMVFFSESPEFVIKSTPAVDVIVTYRGMLDRAPDSAGYRFWVRAVGQSRDSLRDLIEGFLISPEYSNRITP